MNAVRWYLVALCSDHTCLQLYTPIDILSCIELAFSSLQALLLVVLPHPHKHLSSMWVLAGSCNHYTQFSPMIPLMLNDHVCLFM